MEVPSCFYGKYSDVKKAIAKVVTKITKNVPIQEAVDQFPLIELKDSSYLIVMDGPSPLLGGREYFNMFTLPRLLFQKVEPNWSELSRYFSELVTIPWGHMSISCRQHVYRFYATEAHRKKYLYQFLQYIEQYDEINDRFECVLYPFDGIKRPIYDHPEFVGKYVLGNLDYFKEIHQGEDINEILRHHHFLDLIKEYEVDAYVSDTV